MAFGSQPVLSELTFECFPASSTIVMGPGGGGKSTLLRTLSGANDAQPSLRTEGRALYMGSPLAPGSEPRPTLVTQHARLLTASVRENLAVGLARRSQLRAVEQTDRIVAALAALGQSHLADRLGHTVTELELFEQRILAIVRAYLTEAPLVLVDEPTFSLSEERAARVLAALSALARERALLATFHHRGHAQELGGEVLLLASGRVLERAGTRAFFESPQTAAGRIYVETGNVAVPSLDADPETLDEAHVPEPVTPVPSVRPPAPTLEAVGPRHFYWAIEQQLGGCPRPGVVDDEEADVRALASLGITRLLCLEETTTSIELCTQRGIVVEHAPIQDMTAPSVGHMVALCRWLDRQLADGQRVAVHCLAGLGRTGTVLAGYLVWRGAAPLEAIDRIRVLRPRSIQTEEQVELVCAVASARK